MTEPCMSACTVAADLQLFAGMSYALLGPDGKVSKSVNLDVNEPKSAPLNWTGF
jgi:hypothetical protein